MNSEQHALGCVLLTAKVIYVTIADGGSTENVPALLDGLSNVLSHFNDQKQPISKLMGKLKRGIMSKSKAVWQESKIYFTKAYPITDYELEKAAKHIPAIIHANDMICAKFVSGDIQRVKTMCDAMKSYPGFLFGEFDSLSDKQFYDLVFGYYPKLYNEDFMEQMKHLFTGEEKITE